MLTSVLIFWVVSTHGASAISTQEFSSHQRCEAARQLVLKGVIQPGVRGLNGISVGAVCVQR